jgi:hypothetical protein
LLGVPSVEFDRAVRLAVARIPAGRFKDTDGEQYDIMVRTPIDARPDVRALDQVRVATLPVTRCRSRNLHVWSSPQRRPRFTATTASAR